VPAIFEPILFSLPAQNHDARKHNTDSGSDERCLKIGDPEGETSDDCFTENEKPGKEKYLPMRNFHPR
jgi:hypothetical protein